MQDADLKKKKWVPGVGKYDITTADRFIVRTSPLYQKGR